MSLKPWKVLNQETLIDKSFFKLRVQKCELPDKRVMPNYYIFDYTDWVNIVPITPEGKIVMIRQYRQARSEVFVEIPGGAVDPSPQEEPLKAAQRELFEETGYKAKKWIYKGAHAPNPAMQSNLMHTYLALDCEKMGDQSLDPFEEIEVFLESKSKVKEMLVSGEINHSLMAASLVRCWEQLDSL